MAHAESGFELVEGNDGLRRPCSRLLMYCWLKPEISENGSCVRLFFCLILLTFRPTSLRMSMRKG
jgi:hypothetical protein